MQVLCQHTLLHLQIARQALITMSTIPATTLMFKLHFALDTPAALDKTSAAAALTVTAASATSRLQDCQLLQTCLPACTDAVYPPRHPTWNLLSPVNVGLPHRRFTSSLPMRASSQTVSDRSAPSNTVPAGSRAAGTSHQQGTAVSFVTGFVSQWAARGQQSCRVEDCKETTEYAHRWSLTGQPPQTQCLQLGAHSRTHRAARPHQQAGYSCEFHAKAEQAGVGHRACHLSRVIGLPC